MPQEPASTGSTNSTANSLINAKSDRLSKPWRISEKLPPFIGEWESGVLNGKFKKLNVENGMILEVYHDSKGLPTVGCGHLVVAKDNLKKGDKITSEKAVLFLKEDLKSCEEKVNSAIKVLLYQYEYDALVDIAFNAGTGNGFKGIADEVNKGDYSKIPDFIKKYRTGGGNEKRRASEAKLFEKGEYDASH